MVRVEHAKPKRFSCPDCGRGNFPSVSAMQMHRNAKHKPPMINGKPAERSMLTIDHKPKRKPLWRRILGL